MHRDSPGQIAKHPFCVDWTYLQITTFEPTRNLPVKLWSVLSVKYVRWVVPRNEKELMSEVCKNLTEYTTFEFIQNYIVLHNILGL